MSPYWFEQKLNVPLLVKRGKPEPSSPPLELYDETQSHDFWLTRMRRMLSPSRGSSKHFKIIKMTWWRMDSIFPRLASMLSLLFQQLMYSCNRKRFVSVLFNLEANTILKMVLYLQLFYAVKQKVLRLEGAVFRWYATGSVSLAHLAAWRKR